MSGTSYEDTCPRCGGMMQCYSDWKPWDMVNGICLDCGFTTETVTKLSSLGVVNEQRETLEMELISALRQPTTEWLEGDYEKRCTKEVA